MLVSQCLQLIFDMMCVILTQIHTLYSDCTVFNVKQFCMMPQNGQTALLLAAFGGHASIVTLLLDAKADVYQVDTVSYSLLFGVRRCSLVRILQLISDTIFHVGCHIHSNRGV